jgi:amidohydrolase
MQNSNKSELKEHILELARKNHPEIVKIRRDIHANPEIGFEVHRTAKIAATEMKALGFEVREKVGISGVVADLIVDPKAPTIALRADMDALPMQEMGDAEYKSQVDGAAHMCGHDSHTAMLIGGAKILAQMKPQLKKNVRFLFQPNEENHPGGAPGMIADGALEGVSEIYGIHVWPLLDTGTVATRAGAFFAQPDVFEIKITGKGGHAAAPNLTIDPVVIASQIVTTAQSIVARKVDPLESAVLSFTQIHTGTTHNVIPEKAFIMGTIRTFKKEVQKLVREQLESLAKALCESQGAQMEFSYEEGYPVCYNHPAPVAQVVEKASMLLGKDQTNGDIAPISGGEDFAYYLQKVPGCFYFLGTRNEAKGTGFMCHHPKFNIDEEAMVYGASMHALLAL